MSSTAEQSTYPELLSDLVDRLTELLTTRGLSAAEAKDVAWQAAEMIRRDWAGQAVYIPKGQEYEISQRDIEIYKKFDGSNHAILARHFGLTMRQIYSIIRRVRDRDIRKRQCDLF